MNIKVKKIYHDSKLPFKATPESAGLDVFAYIKNGNADNPNAVTIPAYEYRKIGTGVAIEPPTRTFGAIFARSGLSTKQGLRPTNCVGVCDRDFTGEYIVSLYNDSPTAQTIHHGDRIAQVVILPYVVPDVVEVDELTKTVRGSSGFGSTGK